MKITPAVIIPHRALTLRLHSNSYDISITAADAPADHSDGKERKAFWNQIRNHHTGLPSRTYQIIGIDANGHIGRDAPMPHIGNYGATKWTSNGTELAVLAATLNLTATNTIQSCQNTTWTWQSRDGRARTRVDYILIPTRQLHKVKANTGTVTWKNITRQGTATDHRPVALTIRITPHCETFPPKSKLQGPTRQVNISIIKETWEAWEAD